MKFFNRKRESFSGRESWQKEGDSDRKNISEGYWTEGLLWGKLTERRRFLTEGGTFLIEVKVAQSCPTLCNPVDYTVCGILQARILEWVAIPFSRGSSQPRSPALQADSLPAESQRKPKNTGVGSLSFLWQIFLTQELIRGLLHCRRILYQLNIRETLSDWNLIERRDMPERRTFLWWKYDRKKRKFLTQRRTSLW